MSDMYPMGSLQAPGHCADQHDHHVVATAQPNSNQSFWDLWFVCLFFNSTHIFLNDQLDAAAAYVAGYYNSVVRPNRTAPCDQCPTGLTTASSGGRSSDDCNLCAPGYGGENCATLCGGDAATFGVAGRPKHAPCAPCPSVITGYSFDYLANNLIFAPDLVARSGADTASHCLAEFAQIMDVAWFVGGNATMTMASDATSFAACVAKCKSNPACQYITYDYDASICWVKQHEPGLR